jgi:probable HAF family extracellular repeat protein
MHLNLHLHLYLHRWRCHCRPWLARLACLVALFAPAQGHAEAVYAVHQLPANFNPSDINNAGQMAGALYTSEGSVRAAIYTDGGVVDLGAWSGTYSYATAINDAGAVAANVGWATGDEHAVLYQNGAATDIGAGYAAGINSSGAVVGRQSSNGGSASFVYSNGVVTRLGYLGAGNASAASAINDAGQVVGESNLAHNAQAPTHPYLFDGTLHDLGALSGQGVSSAGVINNAGQVAGYSDAGQGRTHVFFYDHGVMTDLGSFGGFDVTIGGMNQLGQVVGTGNTPDGPDIAFLSRGGSLVDLNTLVDPALGWVITSALDINDHGQIIANACRDSLCSAARPGRRGA